MSRTVGAAGVRGSGSHKFEFEVSLGDAVQASGVLRTASVDWEVTNTEMQQSQGGDRRGCGREEHQA